jgi:phosphoribosylformylglycinamidine synthase I
MGTLRVLVLRAAGINCDEETAFAWRRAGAEANSLHVNRILENPIAIGDYQIITIPGGFSYGDDIASGKILANQLNHHLGDAINAFVDRGGLVLGICNGFQVLVQMGLLPGSDCGVPCTLTLNDSGRYEDRWVTVRADAPLCAFLDPGAVFQFPVAHGEGKLLTSDGEASVARLEASNRIALKYVSPNGETPTFPENPNGSIGNVAGLTDATGRVFGLMPHPERNLFTTPRRCTNRDSNTETAGSRFFRRIVERIS